MRISKVILLGGRIKLREGRPFSTAREENIIQSTYKVRSTSLSEALALYCSPFRYQLEMLPTCVWKGNGEI